MQHNMSMIYVNMYAHIKYVVCYVYSFKEYNMEIFVNTVHVTYLKLIKTEYLSYRFYRTEQDEVDRVFDSSI